MLVIALAIVGCTAVGATWIASEAFLRVRAVERRLYKAEAVVDEKDGKTTVHLYI